MSTTTTRLGRGEEQKINKYKFAPKDGESLKTGGGASGFFRKNSGAILLSGWALLRGRAAVCERHWNRV